MLYTNCPAEINAYLSDIHMDDLELAAARWQDEQDALDADSRRIAQSVTVAMAAINAAWVNEDGTSEVWVSDFTDADVNYWVSKGYTRELVESVRIKCEDVLF